MFYVLVSTRMAEKTITQEVPEVCPTNVEEILLDDVAARQEPDTEVPQGM